MKLDVSIIKQLENDKEEYIVKTISFSLDSNCKNMERKELENYFYKLIKTVKIKDDIITSRIKDSQDEILKYHIDLYLDDKKKPFLGGASISGRTLHSTTLAAKSILESLRSQLVRQLCNTLGVLK